jgi:glycosyltransferase involved in cell wall biosynthesis
VKIAYTTYWNAADVTSWSGTVHFIAKAIEKQNIEIEYIDNLHSFKHDIYKIKAFYYKKILHSNYQRFREPRIIKDIAKRISAKLKNSNADLILSPGSLETSLLDTEKPIVIWTDATFAGLLNFYPEYTNLDKKTIENGHYLEQSAFDRSSLIIFSSDWAAETALKYYDVKPEKIAVIPFGANVIEEIDENTIRESINDKLRDKISILFVGVRWHQKGGDIVYEVVRQLRAKGLDIQLDIVGCQPETDEPLPDYVIPHGFLNKNNSEQWEKLKALFLNASFFVMPTKAEAYGLVFCEANAFGVPAIGTNIGGVPTIIKNNINGVLVNPQNAKEEITEIILHYSKDKQSYKDLSLNSYSEYRRRLNWQVAGTRFKNLLEQSLLL